MTKIENEKQYNWAMSRVEDLLSMTNEDTPADEPYMIELKLLSDLCSDYSDEHYSIGTPKLIDVVKLRMFEMGLNQTALSNILGVSKSRISDYLNGRSEPTLSVARRMSKELGIDAEIVLGV